MTKTSDFLSLTQLYPFLQALSIDIFGHSLLALRFTNAIFGALTVFPVYALARLLFDRKIALSAAFLLATLPVHLQFSRIAIAHIADPFFGTLALAFVVLGLQKNHRLVWTLGGAALGMTQYFFESGRLLFPVLVGIWLSVQLLPRPHLLMRTASGIGIFSVTALLTAFPVYYTVWARNSNAFNRFSDSGFQWRTIITDGHIGFYEVRLISERLLTPFHAYINRPDEKWIFYGGGQAIVNDWLIPLFLLGGFFALWRWRQPAGVLAFWLAGAAMGNALMKDLFIYPRYLVAFPAVAIVLAVGVWQLFPLLMPQSRRQKLLIPLTVGILGLGITQATYYFSLHLPRLNQQLWALKPSGDAIDAVLQMQSFPSNTAIFIVDDYVANYMVSKAFLDFLHPDSSTLSLETLSTTPFFRDHLPKFSAIPDKNYAVFIRENDDAINTYFEDYLATNFKDWQTQDTPYTDVPLAKRYRAYFIPAQSGD